LEYKKDYFGFIYLWFDKKRKMFYLGSHMGSIDDGYICSQSRMRNAYNRRQDTFKRRILYYHPFADRVTLLEKEEQWLKLIDPVHLSKKYYNACNRAWGSSQERTSQTQKASWNEKRRAQQAENMKRAWTPERRAAHSERLKQKWSENDSWRDGNAQRMKNRHGDDKFLQRLRKGASLHAKHVFYQKKAAPK
jgi:hypothetical protein